MKNFFLFLIVFLTAYFPSFGQDTIHFKNGEIKSVQLIEVGTSEIKFRSFSNTEEPLYTVKNYDLNFIKYKSGHVDTFKVNPPPAQKEDLHIFNTKNRWSYKNLAITPKEALVIAHDYAKKSNNQELLRLTTRTIHNQKLQKKFFRSGIAVGATGAVLFGVGTFLGLLEEGGDISEPMVLIGFFICAPVGISLEIASIVNAAKKHKRFKKTISLYNLSV